MNGCDRGICGTVLIFPNAKYSQVRLPLMESIQRIMIRTQILWNRLPSNRSIEHATKCPTIDDRVDSESDDAPSVLIHNDQHPVRAQCHRFTSEHIDAMQAVFRVTDKGEPGRSITIGRRMVVGKNPADDILVNRYAKGQLDLLCDARSSPAWITLFYIDNSTNQIRVRILRSRLPSALWRK